MKLIAPFLRLRARVQHKYGLRATPDSAGANAYEKLGSVLGNSRTMWRIWGLLPIIQWLISLERSPPATRTLLTIERLQGWSMLAYYPLEHLYFLLSHNIIPSTITSPLSFFSSSKTAKRLKLNANKISLWSTRFWALYVFLHFAHLVEDRKLLIQRHKALKMSKGGAGLTKKEKKEMGERWDAFWSEVVINLGYLPLTIHWSLEKGLFKNDVWVGLFGLVAAVTSFRTGWKATALPPPPPTPPAAAAEEKKEESSPSAAGYEL
ncbi:hypothetical protein H1R20_g16172, partial [Candolleomyces eurysporus]